MNLVLAILPWLISACTITQVVLAGNQHRQAWSVGLANQGLWVWWILWTHNYGLLPMNLALVVVFARNHAKWNPRRRRTAFIDIGRPLP